MGCSGKKKPSENPAEKSVGKVDTSKEGAKTAPAKPATEPGAKDGVKTPTTPKTPGVTAPTAVKQPTAPAPATTVKTPAVPAPAAGELAVAVAFEALVVKHCACKDHACAAAVGQEIQALQKAHPTKPTPAAMQRIGAGMKRMSACSKALAVAAKPTTPGLKIPTPPGTPTVKAPTPPGTPAVKVAIPPGTPAAKARVVPSGSPKLASGPDSAGLVEGKKLIDETAGVMTKFVAALKGAKGDKAKIEALKAKFQKDNVGLKARGEALKTKLTPADMEAVKAYAQVKLKPIMQQMFAAMMASQGGLKAPQITPPKGPAVIKPGAVPPPLR